jgi:hypothetical protein
MIQGNTPKKREAALLDYLSTEIYWGHRPVRGFVEQRKRLEAFRDDWARFSENTRLVRIYSTEI